MAFTIYTYGDPEADILLLQAVDDHDMAVIEKEVSHIGNSPPIGISALRL